MYFMKGTECKYQNGIGGDEMTLEDYYYRETELVWHHHIRLHPRHVRSDREFLYELYEAEEQKERSKDSKLKRWTRAVLAFCTNWKNRSIL